MDLRHVGLDPVFSACAKLYACQIQRLEQSEQNPGVFSYRGHALMSVELVGRVSQIHIKHNTFIKYLVDDGTGLVPVVCWPADDWLSPEHVTGMQASLPDGLNGKVNELLAERESSQEPYELGDLIRVQGRLKIMRDQIEISASYHQKLEHAMHEVLNMAEKPRIHREVYNNPVCLPPRVARDSTDIYAGFEQAHLTIQVESCIARHFQERVEIDAVHKAEIDAWISTLMAEKNVLGPAERDRLRDNALEALCKKGQIFIPSADGPTYKSASSEDLKMAVLEVIRRNMNSRNGGGASGCHIHLIFRQISSQSSFRHITKETIQQCVANLEANSDVLCSSKDHYIVFGD